MTQAEQDAPVTVRDVAALAGVSPGTVSKVLNGRGTLSQETRRKVLATVEELGFRPNQNARNLTKGRTYTVGLLTSDSFGRFTLPIMQGIEDSLGASRLSTMLCDGRGDPMRERHYLQELLDRRVDGLVITGRLCDPRPSLGKLPIPVVYVLAPSSDETDFSITTDEIQGATLAVRHLIDLGRTRITYVGGPERHLSARLRRHGARQTMEAAGLELPDEHALFGQWSEVWGRRACGEMLRRVPGMDGIFCGSDQIARGVMDTLRESGRRIPEDVAVVGFDNWEILIEGTRPLLTTIDQNLAALGRRAGEDLVSAIEGGELGHGTVRLPCDIIIRQSTM